MGLAILCYFPGSLTFQVIFALFAILEVQRKQGGLTSTGRLRSFRAIELLVFFQSSFTEARVLTLGTVQGAGKVFVNVEGVTPKLKVGQRSKVANFTNKGGHCDKRYNLVGSQKGLCDFLILETLS